ncbi:MAG: hypothetical protein WCG47_32675 [Dermatophilaceae bacterium]
MPTLALALECARAAYGLVQLAAPGVIADAVGGRRTDRPTRAVIRVLGGRHLVQAVLTVAIGTPRAHAVGSGVDALHAMSMYAVAGADRERRRLALASAADATVAALAEAAVARSLRQRPAAHS